MRYLVTTKEAYTPFLTNWFDLENHFNHDIEMTVYDLQNYVYCTDGKTWQDIEIDNL